MRAQSGAGILGPRAATGPQKTGLTRKDSCTAQPIARNAGVRLQSGAHKATKANSPPAASSSPERAAWILESPNRGPSAVMIATCTCAEQRLRP